ncbi:MAG: alpha/beta hydrolase [Anaerolineae bacterium]
MRKIQFHSADNENVHGDLFEPALSGKHPAVLFTHGLLSARQEFGDYPERLAGLGYVTLSIDQRGHGLSGGPRGYVTPARGIQDIHAALDFLAGLATVDVTRLALVGHSLGAAFSICAAAVEPRVKTLVAIAPPASIRAELKPGEGALYALAGGVGKLYRRATGKLLYLPYRVGVNDLFHHEAARQAARQADFLQKQAPSETASALVNELDTNSAAAQVRIPTLIMQAEHDRIVTTARQVYETLSGPKQFVQVDDSGHSIMTDGHGAEAFEIVAEWLTKNLQEVKS